MSKRMAGSTSELGLASARRIVVKIGSSLLVQEPSGEIRRSWLDALSDDLAALRAEGKEVLVVSSGAIAVGRRHLGLTKRRILLEEKQAAAATGQIRLAHAYQESLARHSITVAQIKSSSLSPIRKNGAATSTPGQRSPRCCGWVRSPSSMKTTPWPPARYGSATTTAWPPASPP
jgi:hypothetical protein